MADKIEQLEEQIAYLEGKLTSLAEKSNIKLTFDTTATNQITQQLNVQDGLNKKGIENAKLMLNMENERLSLLLKAKPELQNVIRSQLEANILKSKQLQDYEKEQDHLKKSLEKNLGIKDEVTHIGLKLQEIKEVSKVQLTQEEAIEILKKKQQQTISNITETLMKMSGIILDKALEFEGAAKSLMRAGTFTQEEAINGLMQVTNKAAMAGVGLEQASKAMVGLKTSFSGFTSLTAAESTKVTTLVATMERMGLSVNASAKFLDTATKSLGMSTTKATNFLSSLEGFAKKSGIPITELSKNLEGATDKIALFGDKGTEVFKEMSLVSKQLGIEMNTLYNITERFTTFEGAADAAGKLNAVLGGDFINSVDLLTASMEDPAEAFKMLKMSMDQSGQSFDQMDNGMKRVIASSIGMTVEQAGKLFSQDINTATMAMKQQAKTQEELTKIGAELTTIQEKFQNALIKLWPTLQPVVEMLANLGMKVFDLVEKFFKIEGIIPVMETLVTVILIFGGAMLTANAVLIPFLAIWKSILVVKQAYFGITTAVSGAQKILTALKVADTAASTAQAGAETGKNAALGAGIPVTAAAGTTAAGAATGFLALGAGILMAGLGIALVIGSVALLAYAIKDLSGTQMLFLLGITFGIIAAFAIFAIAAVKMTFPLLFAAAAIAALGAAALIASLPIGLISAAISLMALSIAHMASEMTEFNKSLASVNEGVVTKYNSIADAFKSISGYMKEIDSAKLAMLLSAGTLATAGNFVQASPQGGKQVDLNFEITDAETGQTTKTTSSGGSGGSSNQIIQISLNIDSPIMLDKDKVGTFTHTEVKNVLADGAVKGVVPARG